MKKTFAKCVAPEFGKNADANTNPQPQIMLTEQMEPDAKSIPAAPSAGTREISDIHDVSSPWVFEANAERLISCLKATLATLLYLGIL